MNKSYRGDVNDSGSSGKKADVSAEIRNLIAKANDGKTDFALFSQLRGKYGNNDKLIDAIFDGYKEKLQMIRKKANKFRQVINDRYSKLNLSVPQIMKKARKYKKRYQLSSEEFEHFLNTVLSSKTSTGMSLPNTNMAKTLGFGTTLAQSDKLRVRDDEFGVLQEILQIHAETKPLHSQVILQSFSYDDYSLTARNGEYKRESHNVYSYVHPIVAALFLPKIKYLEQHMLLASISNIVKLKKEGKPIQTQPEYNLFYNLINDPNDTVCDMSSPLKDLRNRIVLQTRLWDAVLNLRQGKYYNDRLVNFLVAIENCRNNVYDVPDLTYVKDEGTILRRLLSAFSLRPTVVSTLPIIPAMTSNPHINPGAVAQVTTIPMVNLRLPIQLHNSDSSVELKLALEQSHWYVENKMLVPKAQTIVYSKEVLFFYVSRRSQMIQVSNSMHYNFNSLPMTMSGMETLNSRRVDFDPVMEIHGENYRLTSVVCVETTKLGNNNKEIITGCSTGVFTYPDTGATANPSINDVTVYNPAAAGHISYKNDETTVRPPIGNYRAQNEIQDYLDRCSTHGTIFLYTRVGNEPPTNQAVNMIINSNQ